MESNASFLQEYDKGLLLFSVDYYVEHIHPVISTGYNDNEGSELS